MAIDWAAAILGGLNRGAAVLRWAKKEQIVWQVKNQVIGGCLMSLHHDIVHKCRRVGAAIDEGRSDLAAHLAADYVNAVHGLMCRVLELQPNDLHCCIKLIRDTDSNGDDLLGTWVRSEPQDDRPIKANPQADFHPIRNNSVWSAFYAVNDGVTTWSRVRCFACNDLVTRGAVFKCDREDWQKYYRSTLVFPINLAKNAEGTEFDRLGFLALDSPRTGAFRGVPDVFDYREKLSDYNTLLWKSAAYHLGAICADILGESLINMEAMFSGAAAITHARQTRLLEPPNAEAD